VRSDAHGFTILEVTVATVVFGFALALIGGALTGSLRSSAEIYVVSEGSQAAEGVSNSIVQRLRGGAVLTSIGATELGYRVPVVVDDERLNFEGNPFLGGGNILGFSEVYTFVPGGQINETRNQLDINDDGDLGDTFRLGTIERRILDAAGAVVRAEVVSMSGRVIQPLVGEVDPAVPAVFEPAPGGGVLVQITSIHSPVAGPDRTSRLFRGTRRYTPR
jgi:hypothetical protein